MPCLFIGASLALALLAFAEPIHTASAAGLDSCKADAERICPGITPGDGKLIGCLKEPKKFARRKFWDSLPSVGLAVGLRDLLAVRWSKSWRTRPRVRLAASPYAPQVSGDI